MPTFKSIRETARALDFSEHLLRAMVKRGEIPGFYSGSKFLVNQELFVEMLTERSRTTVKTEE